VVIYTEDFHLTPTKIANRIGRSRQQVYQTLARFNETKTVKDRPRAGRKRIYSEAEEKKIVRKAKKRKKAPQIAREMGEKSSVRTVERTLKRKGFYYRKVKKVEKLTEEHKRNRVKYATEMKGYKWRTVLFSDEKTFQLGASDEYAWQMPGDTIVEEYVKHAPKLHVWGAIGSYVKTPLYLFKENLNSALYQKILKQSIQENKLFYAPDAPKNLVKRWDFLQDNARTHTATRSMKVIEELVGDRVIKHPPKSPDLNPIEDVWSYLDRKVKEAKVTSILALKRKLNKEWKDLRWSEIRKSVDSMSRRLKSCIECGGSRLDY
jgi:transposase